MAAERTPDIATGRLLAEDYAANFGDLHPPLDKHQAVVEADRCYFCYDAPCIAACPTGIDIPMFIREILADNPKGAAETIFAENIFGGMCARVCPTETLCEHACVREAAEVFHARRDRIVALLNAVPGIRCPQPQGAFYVYPSVEGLLGRRTADGRVLQTDLDVVMFLLDSAGVAVLDGAAYGLSPYLRLSFATSMENIEEGCRRIREACGALS